MDEPKSNSTNSVWMPLMVLAIIVVLSASSFKGCIPGFHGFEIGTLIGKVTVKPVTPPKPILPPKTRCLIFGFSSCPACRELHKTVRRMNGWNVGSAPTDDIEEIDIYSNDRRVKKYRHSQYPTLIIVDQNENEVSRKTDAMSGQALAAWIQSTR